MHIFNLKLSLVFSTGQRLVNKGSVTVCVYAWSCANVKKTIKFRYIKVYIDKFVKDVNILS